MLRQRVLVGAEGERVRHLLPADPDFQFDELGFTTVLETYCGEPVAAASYWHIVPFTVFGAVIGVPQPILRRLSPYEASLLLPPFTPCAVCVRVHAGHPGAEKLLKKLGFVERFGVHTLFLPYELDLGWFEGPTRQPRRAPQAHGEAPSS